MPSIGIDFGTSNSSVAVFHGDRVELLPLDAHARDPRVMRSLLYITRAGELHAGQRALDLYTEQNTGREVRMERRYIGEVKMTFSDMEVVKDAFAMVDVNEPGRLARMSTDPSCTTRRVFVCPGAAGRHASPEPRNLEPIAKRREAMR